MTTDTTFEITGLVVRRRSFGKFLAFAEIQLPDDNIIKVAFRRASPTWNNDAENFPMTASALPYGAKLRLILLELEPGNIEVHSWNILEHPKLVAQQIATQSDGVMYSIYLRERGNDFQSLHCKHPPLHSERRTRPPKELPNELLLETNHGDTSAKGLRAKVFCAWIIETFGMESLSRHGVLDIAGGKGQLSVELAVMGNIPCTLIDPLLRKRRFLKKDMKRIQKMQAPVPEHLAQPLDHNDLVQQEKIKRTRCLVGLHPDECTEEILQVALLHNKSVAIVPCCVFPTFFPWRQLADGSSVVSHSDFCQYLLQKDGRLRQATLGFEGRNEVIYYDALEHEPPLDTSTGIVQVL